jgi:hypothetical protein
MRIYLAVAVILAFGIEAHGQDIGKRCLAEAAAKGLYGQERMHFQARCKAGPLQKGRQLHLQLQAEQRQRLRTGIQGGNIRTDIIVAWIVWPP